MITERHFHDILTAFPILFIEELKQTTNDQLPLCILLLKITGEVIFTHFLALFVEGTIYLWQFGVQNLVQ